MTAGAHALPLDLRRFAIAAGLICAALFPLVALACDLQLFGDGSIFSYAIAAQDNWAFHWRNIPPRIFVYLYALAPGEALAAIAQSARAGIFAYGVLFYFAPALGLAATWIVDRSGPKTFYAFACFSTAALCPLTFGFPTEMWIAHALFWPVLALAICAPPTARSVILLALFAQAMVLSHEGAWAMCLTIACALWLQGAPFARLWRFIWIACAVFLCWLAVKSSITPDAYFASVLVRAADNVFNPALLTTPLTISLAAALASYAIVFVTIRKSARAPLFAAGVTGLALAIYWLAFDTAIHAEDRYYMRTLLLCGACALGLAAAICHRTGDRASANADTKLGNLRARLQTPQAQRAIAGAFALLLLVHAVETAKFAAGWRHYKSAVRALAMSDLSDPQLGDVKFVSAHRIDPSWRKWGWSSTTLYLSILLAPTMTPNRLVIDPQGYYYWLDCDTARRNERTQNTVPRAARALVRVYACLKRP